MKITSVEFTTSAVRRSQYPTDEMPEFLLVGRSNVGKSSFINTLVNRKSLARISSIPGKTQTLNLIERDDLVLFSAIDKEGKKEVHQKIIMIKIKKLLEIL